MKAASSLWAGFVGASRALMMPASQRSYSHGKKWKPKPQRGTTSNRTWVLARTWIDEDFEEKPPRRVDPEKRAKRALMRKLVTPLDRWRHDLETGKLLSENKKEWNERRALKMLPTIHPITTTDGAPQRGKKIEMAIRDAALRFDSCREQALKAASLSKIKVNPKRHVHGREAAHVLLYEGLALKKAESQFLLGLLLQKVHLSARHNTNGLGVAYDESRAAQLYGMAAAQGHPIASFNYAVFALRGRGVHCNPQLTAKFMTQAAQGGVPQAQYALGILYMVGQGVDRDTEKAAKWMALAVKAGFTPHEQPKESRSHAMQTPTQAQRIVDYDASGKDLEIDMSINLDSALVMRDERGGPSLPDAITHVVAEQSEDAPRGDELGVERDVTSVDDLGKGPSKKQLLEFLREQERGQDDEDEWGEWGSSDLCVRDTGQTSEQGGGRWRREEAVNDGGRRGAVSGGGVKSQGVRELLMLLEEEEEEGRQRKAAGHNNLCDQPAPQGTGAWDALEKLQGSSGGEEMSLDDSEGVIERGALAGEVTGIHVASAVVEEDKRRNETFGSMQFAEAVGAVEDGRGDSAARSLRGGEDDVDDKLSVSTNRPGQTGASSLNGGTAPMPADELKVSGEVRFGGSSSGTKASATSGQQEGGGGSGDFNGDDDDGGLKNFVGGGSASRGSNHKNGVDGDKNYEDMVGGQEFDKDTLKEILAELEEEEKEESKRGAERLSGLMSELEQARSANDARRISELTSRISEQDREGEEEEEPVNMSEMKAMFLKETGLDKNPEFLRKYGLKSDGSDAEEWKQPDLKEGDDVEESSEDKEAYARAMQAMGLEEERDEQGNLKGWKEADRAKSFEQRVGKAAENRGSRSDGRAAGGMAGGVGGEELVGKAAYDGGTQRDKRDAGGSERGVSKAAEDEGTRDDGKAAGSIKTKDCNLPNTKKGGKLSASQKRAKKMEHEGNSEIMSRIGKWNESSGWVDSDQGRGGGVEEEEDALSNSIRRDQLEEWWRNVGKRFKGDNPLLGQGAGGKREQLGEPTEDAEDLGQKEEEVIDDEEDNNWFRVDEEKSESHGDASISGAGLKADERTSGKSRAAADTHAQREGQDVTEKRREAARLAAALRIEQAWEAARRSAPSQEEGIVGLGEENPEFKADDIGLCEQEVDGGSLNGEGKNRGSSADARGVGAQKADDEDVWADFDTVAKGQMRENDGKNTIHKDAPVATLGKESGKKRTGKVRKAAESASFDEEDLFARSDDAESKGRRQRSQVVDFFDEGEDDELENDPYKDPHGTLRLKDWRDAEDAKGTAVGNALFQKLFAEEAEHWKKRQESSPNNKWLFEDDSKDAALSKKPRNSEESVRVDDDRDAWDEEEGIRAHAQKLVPRVEEVWDDGQWDETSTGKGARTLNNVQEEGEEARVFRDIVSGRRGWGGTGVEEDDSHVDGNQGVQKIRERVSTPEIAKGAVLQRDVEDARHEEELKLGERQSKMTKLQEMEGKRERERESKMEEEENGERERENKMKEMAKETERENDKERERQSKMAKLMDEKRALLARMAAIENEMKGGNTGEEGTSQQEEKEAVSKEHDDDLHGSDLHHKGSASQQDVKKKTVIEEEDEESGGTGAHSKGSTSQQKSEQQGGYKNSVREGILALWREEVERVAQGRESLLGPHVEPDAQSRQQVDKKTEDKGQSEWEKQSTFGDDDDDIKWSDIFTEEELAEIERHKHANPEEEVKEMEDFWKFVDESQGEKPRKGTQKPKPPGSPRSERTWRGDEEGEEVTFGGFRKGMADADNEENVEKFSEYSDREWGKTTEVRKQNLEKEVNDLLERELRKLGKPAED